MLLIKSLQLLEKFQKLSNITPETGGLTMEISKVPDW